MRTNEKKEKRIETFRLLTPSQAVEAVEDGAAATVLEALPQSADEAATIDALATDTDLTPSTVRRVLTQIDVKRIGARRRGDPHRFFAFHSHQIPKVGEKQETKLQVIREEADDANDVARF